jgi:DNA polymerase-3 subunit delta'
MTNWGVIGQERAVAFLQRAVAHGRLHHAYLLSGPPQVGKRTLALAFAQALNCEWVEPPCQQCRSCQRIARGFHPDVVVLGLQTDERSEQGRLRKNIGIGQVQELAAALALQPYEGRWRCVIIDGAERLSVEAANALLKTLEEPPPQVLLIVLTVDPEQLLPTIRSRCQRLDLCLVAEAVIAAELHRQGAPEETARHLARLANGRPGWALAAFRDPDQLTTRSEQLTLLVEALRGDTLQRLDQAAKLATRFAASREEVYATLDLWQGWLRDVLVLAAGGADLLWNQDWAATLHTVAATVAPAQARAGIEALRRCRRQLEANVNARLALEAALLDLPTLPTAALAS